MRFVSSPVSVSHGVWQGAQIDPVGLYHSWGILSLGDLFYINIHIYIYLSICLSIYMVVLEVELRASCMDILSYSKQQKKKKYILCPRGRYYLISQGDCNKQDPEIWARWELWGPCNLGMSSRRPQGFSGTWEVAGGLSLLPPGQ
jgi:hypothetical protein